MAGNGYHGRCAHCGLACETDLGYSSWAGTKCIDREITDEADMPDNIKSYARFFNLRWDRKRKIFVRPYSDRQHTLDELNEHVQSLLGQPS